MKKKLVITFTLIIIMTLIMACSTDETTSSEEITMTPEELTEYDGMDGNAAYVAVDGIIYDVTDEYQWDEGEHNGFKAGKDLTDEIKNISPHGVSKLEALPKIGKLVE